MGKATIIEAQNSNTVYKEGQQSGILGKLKGIFADYKHGTRNADRLYTEQLWDNRVFGSQDVMEALQTKTLFGELDHPEGDRCETLAKNAAISITKLEKKPEEGVIYGEADILDTPTGRIVKALADSGAKLGISSRGMGEEIYQDGQNIIDPDTYDFITFDVVVTPANTKARVALTESKHISKLTESLQKEINECETDNQLNQIKQVVETLNINDKEIIESIDSKLNKEESTEEQKQLKPEIEAKRQQLVCSLLRNKLSQTTAQLQESLQANEQLSLENNKLIESKEFLEESRNNLKTKLKTTLANQNECLHNIDNLNKQNEESKKDLEESMKLVARQDNSNQIALQKQRSMYEGKIEQLNKEISSLKENQGVSNEQYSKILEENKQLNKTILDLNKKLDDNSKILMNSNKQVNELNESLRKMKANARLTESKIQESKLQESKKVKELEDKVKELESIQRNFTQLSFNPMGSFTALRENNSLDQYDEEDLELLNVLTNK